MPPDRTHLPRPQVLGRDGVRHSAGRPHTCTPFGPRSPPEGHRDDAARRGETAHWHCAGAQRQCMCAAHCTPHLRRTAGAVQVGAGPGRCAAVQAEPHTCAPRPGGERPATAVKVGAGSSTRTSGCAIARETEKPPTTLSRRCDGARWRCPQDLDRAAENPAPASVARLTRSRGTV